MIDPTAPLRKGQTLFLFLTWLTQHKDIHTTFICYTGKSSNKADDVHFHMADPFNIPDEKWDALYAEFLAELASKETK